MRASDDLLNQAASLRENQAPNLVQQAMPSDSLLDGITTRQKQQTDLVLDVVSKTQPDQAAQAQKLGKEFGLDPLTVQQNQSEIERMARIREAQKLMQASPVLARQMIDPAFASIAQDDLENLTALDSTLKFFKNTGNAAVSGVRGASGGVARLAGAGFDLAAPLLDPLVGTVLPGNPLRVTGEGLGNFGRNVQAQAKAEMPKGDGNIESGFYSGVASLVNNLATLPLAFLPGGQGAALTAMTAPVVGQEYGKARDAGMNPLAAATFGASQGAIEFATEKVPLTKLIGDVKAGTSFFKTLTKQAALEVPGEQAATALQDLNDWAALNPGKPFSSYVEERPAAAVQTLVATLVGVGGQVSVTKGLDTVVQRFVQQADMAQRADQNSQALDALGQLAAASKVRERDAETFEQFVAQATEDGPVQDVFINAQVLNQSGMLEQLAEASPSVREQFEIALATGADVRIPVAEYTARIAGTELNQSLLDHLKVEPNGFSRAEAQVFMQSYAQNLEEEVQRLVDVQEEVNTLRAGIDEVKATVKTQLDQVGRFTANVNEGYATLMGNFFGVMGAKLGVSPQELYARYTPRFQAESVTGGQVLNQALASQPPKGWVPVENGSEVSLVLDSDSETKAVFWPGVGQKLVGQVPELAGYSYSLSRGSVKHILDKHGNAKQEASRGQVAVNKADFERIPDIIAEFDSARTDLLSEQGSKRVALLKRFDDSVVVLVGDVGQKKQDFRAVTMWKYPPTVDTEGLLERVTDVKPANTKARKTGLLADALRPLSDYESDAQTPSTSESVSNSNPVRNSDLLNQTKGTERGSFDPATNMITMLKNADLSTFLHESGHFFLEVQFDIAARLEQEAAAFGAETNKPGEQDILRDTQAVLRWFGLRDLNEWNSLDFEEKRSYHEKFARGFEAYLFEGQAPSIELQKVFQTFRSWLTNVYRQVVAAARKALGDKASETKTIGKALDVELSTKVRQVFDRMLATEDQIQLAEQGRSMLPLFTAAEQAAMTVDEFAAYQALGKQAQSDAVDDVQARTLRDLAYARNARGREIKRLQKQAAEARAEVQMGVRREVMSQPVYRAWTFLTSRLGEGDKLTPQTARKSDPNVLDETQDSLFTAIAKLGGLSKDEVVGTWGTDPADKPNSGVFGKPVWRVTDGRSIDDMAQALGEAGYLQLDENGKVDLTEFEARFDSEVRGSPQYSVNYMPEQESRAGDQVVNSSGLTAGRIDAAALNEMDVPNEILDRIKSLKMTAKTGLHPDMVAEMFGFTSGDELVRTLAMTNPPATEIEGLTDARMLEQYGELATPEAIERAADVAIHNDARGRFIATEANALARATGSRKILSSAAKQLANTMIARLKVRNIRPGQYTNASARAAKASAKASQSGDLGTAAAEKRNQLVNHYAARAAFDAQTEIEKGVRYLRKFESDSTRKGLDADYTDQIDALLERFDLRKGTTLKAIDKRKSLAKWIEAQREAGFEPDIPVDIEQETTQKSYKEMTVEEFRGLVDTVKQIENLGRLKNKLLTAADNRAFAEVVDLVSTSITDNAGERTADTRTPTTNLGRYAQTLKRFWASHIKAATWARVMDGGQDGGPVWEYFVRQANQRADQETQMRADATQALSKILAPVFAQGKMGGNGQFFASIGRSLNREARLAIALNTGNQGNLQRLLGGEGWTLEQLMPVLQSLTVAEWTAVQDVWNHFESYRPQIAAKERRIYGKEPNWVEPQPFDIQAADGSTVTIKGGYYPIKYDPQASQRAEQFADAEDAKRMLQGAFTSATTRRSFTKSRTEEVSGRPLVYTLAGMYSGVNDVIHDLAWHEWLIDTQRLLRAKPIDTAIRTKYGPEVNQQFKSWVQDIADGEKGAQGAAEVALSRLRQGVSAAGLGFSFMSAAIQITGFNQSIVRVGAGYIGRGVSQYLRSPVGSAREVVEKSTFMADRARTQFRELNELRNKVEGENPVLSKIQENSYWMMMRVQKMVDVPTWLGAYEKAIGEGNDEGRAVALADQAVRDSQGSGMVSDLSAVERGGPAQKLFTVFYSYMNTALNLGVAQTMTAKSKAKLAGDMLMLFTVPAILGSLLKDALTPGGGDDEEDWEQLARNLAAEQLSYLMGTMVIVREFSAAARMVTGAEGARGYEGPAGLRLIGESLRLVNQAQQGEFDDAFRKSAVNTVGALLGLPAAQINRSITGAQALADDKTDNPAALLFGYQE